MKKLLKNKGCDTSKNIKNNINSTEKEERNLITNKQNEKRMKKVITSSVSVIVAISILTAIIVPYIKKENSGTNKESDSLTYSNIENIDSNNENNTNEIDDSSTPSLSNMKASKKSAKSNSGKYTVNLTPTKYEYLKYWGKTGSVASPNERGWETFNKRTVAETGQPAYCLEFGKDFVSGTKTNEIEVEKTKAWKNASNLAKLGVTLATIYGYPNNYSELGDAAYYATQMIIWEYMQGYRKDITGDVYGDINGGYSENNICCRFLLSMQTKGYSDIETAYRGILNMMSKHYTKPSFNDNVVKLDFDPQTRTYSKTLVDTNGIFEEFDLMEVENGITVEKNGNTITVSSQNYIEAPKAKGKTYEGGKTVTLGKRHTFNDGCVALYAKGNPSYQTLICGTISNPKISKIVFYTDNGHLKVTTHSEDDDVKNIKFNIRCDEIGFNKDCVTDENGKIELEGLPVGYNYTITEYTPDKYVPTKERTVTVDANVIPNVHFYNYLKKGSVEVHLTDKTTGAALKGAEFVICEGTAWDWGKLVWNDDLINADGTVGNDYFVTDENGTFTVSNLKSGDYIVMMGQAPDGYELNSEKYPIKIENGNTNITLNVTI